MLQLAPGSLRCHASQTVPGSNMPDTLTLQLGVKTDPVQYRYSYEWLFRLMAEEGVYHAQLGSFFELYQLPDEWFSNLRELAASFDVRISGVFTTHRELGGLFRDEPGWQEAAVRSFRRMIEIAALLGANAAGSNPGSVLRDRMGDKELGIRRYIHAMHELLAYAQQLGVPFVTAEPMSTLAEPPTLAVRDSSDGRRTVRLHAGASGPNRVDSVTASTSPMAMPMRMAWSTGTIFSLFEATFPWLQCVHLKNTDAHFDATFGFTETERARGIIDIPSRP